MERRADCRYLKLELELELEAIVKILVRVRSFAAAMTCDLSFPLRVVSPFPALVCRHSTVAESGTSGS
jgi:hypothetical protein